MCAFELYTNRARRVVVLSAEEAARNSDEKITNAHVLIALARDAATPWPTPRPSRSRADGLPLDEPFSLALRVLGEFGITGDDLVAETSRIAGLVPPSSLEKREPLLENDGAARVLGGERRLAIGFEIAWARGRHDNHLATLHQLVGLGSVRRGAGRQILASLGIPRVGAIKQAARAVEAEREQMRRQMALFALDNPALGKELQRILPGSNSGLRWRRSRLRRAVGDAAG